MFDRRGDVAALLEEVSEVVVRIGGVRRQDERSLVCRDRLVALPDLRQCTRQVVMKIGLTGGELDGPLQVRQPCLRAVPSLEGQPEVVGDHGVPWIEVQRTPVVADGRIEATGLVLQPPADVVQTPGPDGRFRRQRQVARNRDARGEQRGEAQRGISARADVPDAVHDARDGEETEERQRGMTVPRHHEHRDHRRRVDEEQGDDQPRARPATPAEYDPDGRERHEHAVVQRAAGRGEQRRPLGVRVLVLRIADLHAIDEQRRLQSDQPKPVARLGQREADGAPGPVRRDLPGRQLTTDVALGELRGVEPLVVRVAAAVAQRTVHAVRGGIVADVEVRSELRSGHVEFATDHRVSNGDR